MMNRRHFLFNAPVGLALLRSSARAQKPLTPMQLTVHSKELLARIPLDVMGLSYESTQLGTPEFFSAANRNLVKLFRTLTPQGSLRLGGNTSEFTYFRGTVAQQAPPYTPLPTQPAQLTPITPLALSNLRAFLEATNWTCIYGLNLGLGSPERAAEEAEAVVKALGPRLRYFQIGNEPNNYIRYKLRPSTWNASAYLDEWLPFAQAVIARVPGAMIGGPDMGADRQWMQLFADRAVKALRGRLVEITDHFYAEGPPTSPAATIENLLHNIKIEPEISVMQEAGKLAKLPYRMTEVNSCYLGGKPGVSDTMASALWAANLTLRLVTSGFSGINFHGGSAREIKASLGGTLPGDSVSKGSASDSYYTPIAGTSINGYQARPVFYGMMLASKFAGSQLVRVTGATDQLTAYAALGEGIMQLAVFNMDASSVEMVLEGLGGYVRADCIRLEAPGIDALEVTLGGAFVDGKGSWSAPPVQSSEVSNARLNLNVRQYTAALVTLHRAGTMSQP